MTTAAAHEVSQLIMMMAPSHGQPTEHASVHKYIPELGRLVSSRVASPLTDAGAPAGATWVACKRR